MCEEYKGPLLGVRKKGDKAALGTWWWDMKLLVRPDEKTGLTAEKAFDMLVKENVSEIYLEADPASMPEWGSTPANGEVAPEQTAAFIGRCTAEGIRVSALIGRGGKAVLPWFDESRGYPEITEFIKGVESFNAAVPPEQRFYGVHLDIEPDVTENPLKYHTQMRGFLMYAKKLCRQCGLLLELDTTAWYDETNTALDENGKIILMADVVTSCCDSVSVMAYRANAEDQLDLADDLIKAAERNGCAINIGCETGAPESLGEEAFITYANYSPEFFSDEQKKLCAALEEMRLTKGFGTAVHWVNSWYAMNMRALPC